MAGGRKQVIVFEGALFKTLAVYAYILSTCVLCVVTSHMASRSYNSSTTINRNHAL